MTVAKRKILLSGLLGIVSVGMFTTSTFAATPYWVQDMSKPALHESIGKAIVANDYEAFATAIKGKPGAQSISQIQFDALVTARKLHEEGKGSDAQKILSKAGIKSPQHNSDSLRSKSYFTSLNEDQKKGLLKAHELKKAGKYSEAKALMQTLKLPVNHLKNK